MHHFYVTNEELMLVIAVIFPFLVVHLGCVIISVFLNPWYHLAGFFKSVYFRYSLIKTRYYNLKFYLSANRAHWM